MLRIKSYKEKGRWFYDLVEGRYNHSAKVLKSRMNWEDALVVAQENKLTLATFLLLEYVENHNKK